MVVYNRGESYIQKVTIRDENNALFDPDEVEWVVTNPKGEVVAQGQMTKISTGIYKASYDIPNNALYGEYYVKISMIVTDTSTTIEEDEFFVLPLRLEKARQISGIDENSISDKTFSQLLWYSYQLALKETLIYRYDEIPQVSPEGKYIDGTNKIFKVSNPPIADANGDGVIDEEDISGIWIDKDYNVNVVKCTVINAREGIITLTRADNSPLPSDTKKVRIDYYQKPACWDDDIFNEAVLYLASHLAQMRLKEPSKITIADLTSNRLFLEERGNDYYYVYKKLIRNLTGGVFEVT